MLVSKRNHKLRCFDTVFRSPYQCFQIALKVITFISLSDRYEILD